MPPSHPLIFPFDPLECVNYGGDKQKKQESYSTIKNKTHFCLLASDCDFEDALLILIYLNKHET